VDEFLADSSDTSILNDFAQPERPPEMTMRVSAFLCLLLLILGVDPLARRVLAAPPNIVLILVDDLGISDLGCYGSKFHKTPRLDGLAAQGMRFTQAYAASPIGAPTRAAILTGQDPARWNLTVGHPGFPDHPQNRRLQPKPVVLPRETTTLAESLTPLHYTSAAIGKWHLGGQGSAPIDHGFTISLGGTAAGSVMSSRPPYRDSDGVPLPGLDSDTQQSLTDRLADEAGRFLERHVEHPFFLALSFYAVHSPHDAPADQIAPFGAMPKQPTGGQIHPAYAAQLAEVDSAIGRVLDRLTRLKLDEHTIVVVTSDNGGVCNDHGQIIPPTSNAPFRDGKGHLYEGGLRIPLLVKWPGVTSPGTVSDAVVSCLDLAPTLRDACGAAASPADGVSLKPVLDGRGTLTRNTLFWHFPHTAPNAGSRPGGAIRSGDWKLIEFYETGRRELFNLKNDARESNNVFDAQRAVADQLASQLADWRTRVGATLPPENPNYQPNAQREDGSILLHSSTADVSGSMLRYEPLPNKDTLGFWVREEDWARFEFTVTRPGRFHLIPDVGCGTSGGSEVDFEVGGQTLPLTVPATGGFQAFVPQDLGIVTIEKPGRYDLVIRPRKKVGVAVMDVRRVVLKPVELVQHERLPGLHLTTPFWASTTVARESVLFVREASGIARGRLLFPATRILAVHSADGRTHFTTDRDFHLHAEGKELELSPMSRIPAVREEDLFPPRGRFPQWNRDVSLLPQSIPHKLGDPETFLLFNNGHWFHDQQVEVTYERAPADWPGPVPQFRPEVLPKTLARLKSRQTLTLAVSGDSISSGCNASGWAGVAPFMPPYPDLVAAQLRATYGADVTLHNRAVGGWSVPNGLADLETLLNTEPDLILIAYGMNDVGRRNPVAYAEGIRQMLSRIETRRPEAEVILVATMVGNDQWQHTPREMFPQYRDALAQLQKPGVALVDLTALWTEMLRRKRDGDLTGNGVNHPSDFGHRVYASAILSLLIPPSETSPSRSAQP